MPECQDFDINLLFSSYFLIQLSMLPILKYPNPILENVSVEVNLPLASNDLELIRQMFATVKDIGVGLAAPQVGVNKRFFIVHLSGDKNLTKESRSNPDFVVINPNITFKSQVQTDLIEGCLSFPEEFYRIIRPSNILIEFTTISNTLQFVKGEEPIYKKAKLKATNWLARILQHEFDHLEGKIYTKMGGKKLTKRELELEDGDDIID